MQTPIPQNRTRIEALPVFAAVLVFTMSPIRMVAAPQGSAAPEFDAISVKLVDRNVDGEHSREDSDPGHLRMSDSMHRLIIRAYGIADGQLGGEPDWFKKNLYSIDAVASVPSSPAQMMLMLRRALADRFQLKLRQDDRDLPVYSLEVAAGGPKFKELKPGEVPRHEPPPPGIFARGFTSIEDLMNSLNGVFGGSLAMDRPVVDRTQLTGRYNIQLRTAMETQIDGFGHRFVKFPDLFHDMMSELGLNLVPKRVKMPYFVVEHASTPTPN